MVERVSSDVPHEAIERALDELESLIASHAQVAARVCLNHQNPRIVLPPTAPLTR